MTFAFPPDATKLIIPVHVTGPQQGRDIKLTIDTGSAITVLPAWLLPRLGCDLSRPHGYKRLRGIASAARAPLVRVPAVSALGRVRKDLLVAAHDLPLGVESDGLLGLDFFRGLVLTLDFARGRISLAPRRWWHFWR